MHRFRSIAFLIILSAVFSLSLTSQTAKFDSLWAVYNNIKQPDSVRLIAIHKICWSYTSNKPDTAILLGEKELELAIKSKLKKFEARAYNILGASYTNKGLYPKAMENYFLALKKFEEAGNKRGVANCYINIGTLFLYESNYQKALDHFLIGLSICETKNSKGELTNKDGAAACYTNIGNVYFYQKDYKWALKYYMNALKMNEQIGDKHGIAACFGNMGSVYQEIADYKLALVYYLKDLRISKESEDKQEAAICYNKIGGLHLKLLNYKQGVKYCDTSLQIASEIGDLDAIRLSHQNLAKGYEFMGDYKEAYAHHVKCKDLTDTLFNRENSKQMSDLKTKYEVEKKAAELKAQAKAQQAIALVEKKKQKIVIYSVAGLLILALVFTFFLFNRFKVIQRQKNIIEKQKEIVEEHRQEIIDSITYAKRLQQAILPSFNEIKNRFSDSFLLYKPKDIVAGDFYWLEEVEGIIYIAAADCTGHGVPGAIASVVCSNALNRTVKEFDLKETGKILDKTRELVLETFAKSGEEIKDGMDISLLSFDKNRQQVFWSGANNDLWYISDGRLTEIKPDKQAIGKTENPTPFRTHQINFKAGDIFYLMTDGYPDQFGGPKRKKYKYKQLEERIIANCDKDLEDQKIALEKSFLDWMGELEQVDDVTILGVKI